MCKSQDSKYISMQKTLSLLLYKIHFHKIMSHDPHYHTMFHNNKYFIHWHTYINANQVFWMNLLCSVSQSAHLPAYPCKSGTCSSESVAFIYGSLILRKTSHGRTFYCSGHRRDASKACHASTRRPHVTNNESEGQRKFRSIWRCEK